MVARSSFNIGLVLILTTFLLLKSTKHHAADCKGALSIIIGLKLDVKRFPGRNLSGLSRHHKNKTKPAPQNKDDEEEQVKSNSQPGPQNRNNNPKPTVRKPVTVICVGSII